MFKKFAVVISGLFASAQAFALDVTETGPIATALDGAKSDALGVGELVIGTVVALTVVALVLKMISKAG